jgi:hypothetical protein
MHIARKASDFSIFIFTIAGNSYKRIYPPGTNPL